MRRAVLLVVMGWSVAGCSWSNALYQARRLSQSALKAEREERGFDAGSLWGQVAVKADSVRARSGGDNPNGIEASWLRGRALARLGSCTEAVPLLDEARILAGDVDWRDDVTLELARCKAIGGATDETLALLAPLLAGEDAALREEAGALAGRSLLRAGRWQEARDLLAEDESTTGRWLYAVSLAHLGEGNQAFALIEPRIEAGDLTADWAQLVESLASQHVGLADSLLQRLSAIPTITDTLRSNLLLAAATGATPHDSAAATRYLEALVTRPASSATTRGRQLLVLRRMAAVHDDSSLRRTLAAMPGLTFGDAAASFTVQRLARWSGPILHDLETLEPGSKEGDMAMFFHATIAQDTLRAPALAEWLLERLERDWPESPYLPKVLLWRISLEPESADALRERLAQYPDSPYLAWIAGREDPRFAELEYALDFYLGDRFAVSGTDVDQ